MAHVTSSEFDYRATRLWLAAVFLVLPTIIAVLCACYWESARLPDVPSWYAWRFLFCVLAGFWGLALRAFLFRDTFRSSSPWPDYVTVYPFSVIMNASFIFSLLSLPSQLRNILFFTAAAPLCIVLGLYSHPDQWILAHPIKREWPGKGP